MDGDDRVSPVVGACEQQLELPLGDGRGELGGSLLELSVEALVRLAGQELLELDQAVALLEEVVPVAELLLEARELALLSLGATCVVPVARLARGLF